MAIAAKYGQGVILTKIGAKARCNECGGLGGSVLVNRNEFAFV